MAYVRCLSELEDQLAATPILWPCAAELLGTRQRGSDILDAHEEQHFVFSAL